MSSVVEWGVWNQLPSDVLQHVWKFVRDERHVLMRLFVRQRGEHLLPFTPLWKRTEYWSAIHSLGVIDNALVDAVRWEHDIQYQFCEWNFFENNIDTFEEFHVLERVLLNILTQCISSV
jgi:hypothetical protein